ncbi:MAG: hypothetical protein ACRCU3_01660 [Eubacteriaceae bacterium]
MANERELNEKNDYFEYVESRIENLEKLILKKDEELKSLIINATSQNEKKGHSDVGREKLTITSKGSFDKVFEDIKEEEVRFLKKEGKNPENYKTEELNKQLLNIEKREKMVEQMLDSLGNALVLLKKRHEEVNRKEETLNEEYKKLLEIETLYQTAGEIELLGSTFSHFSLNNENEKKGHSFKNDRE